MHDLDARPVVLDNEGRGGIRLLRRGRFGQHDEQAGAGAIGTPELLTVDDEVLPVRRRQGGGGDARRIAAHVSFGQGEGGDFTVGATWQEHLLLFVRAKDNQGLRHADGLVRRDQGGEAAASAAQQHGRA